MLRYSVILFLLHLLGANERSPKIEYSNSVLGITEICDNGIDDDLDGYIDYYDEDCECRDSLFNAQCQLDCEYLPSQSLSFKLKWEQNILVDEFSHGASNIICNGNNLIYLNYANESGDTIRNNISIINSIDGLIINTIIIDSTLFKVSYESSIGKISQNMEQYHFCRTYNGIYALKANGERVWKNYSFSDVYTMFSTPRLADFNEDGRSEVYSGNIILNASTGALLYQGSDGRGCHFWSDLGDTCSIKDQSIAADLTISPGLELLAGNTVYEVEINSNVDSVGNVANIITAPFPVKDGISVPADFDMDGFLDVVTVRSNSKGDGGVWIWNPRNQSIMAFASGVELGRGGGSPVVVDLDGDCIPEIIVAYIRELKIYKYDGSTNLIREHRIETTDNSGFTTSTAFDLDNDGIMELLYRDETTFRVFDGRSFDLIFLDTIYSGTVSEGPIVSDVDNDGQAEILIHGSKESDLSLSLFCYESATIPWAPARKVWNQSGYHVTNVNDDLTIPQYQQNSAAFFDTDSCFQETCPQVYNTFGVQATYRTQKGCVVLPEREILPVEISASHDTICATNNVTLIILTDEDEIRWYTPELSPCTDCDSITISLDTTTWVTVIVGDDRCFVEDSILIFVRQPIELSEIVSICEGDSILFDAIYRKESGTYNRLVGDCDSLIVLELKVLAPVSESIIRSFCEGDSVIVENEVFKEAGTYQINTTSSENCDSIINLTVELYALSALDTTVTICDGDSIFVDGIWYDEDELIMIEETNALGCDSSVMMIIDLVDILTEQDTVRICEGDSTMLHGAWQSLLGEYSDMFTAVSGCDSVFTYHLLVRDTSVVELNETICEGDTFFIDNKMFTEAAFYTYSVISSTMCDSTINLALSVTESPRKTIDLTICEGDSVLISDMWISEESTFEVIKENAGACDSIYTYTISLSAYLTAIEDIFSCEGDTLFFDVIPFTTDTILVDTVAGLDCPTIRFRSVSFLSPSESMIDIVYCDSDTFATSTDTLTESGVAQEILQSALGCDSLVTYDVSFIPRPIQIINYGRCYGDSVLIGDEYYYEEIMFTDTFFGDLCDTTFTYILKFYHPDTGRVDYTLPFGETITVND